MKPIALDFETPYGKDFSVVDLGYDRYARDARCIPYLVAVSDGSENWAGRPSEFNFESLRGRDLVSHNSAFDEEISLGAAERELFTVPGLSRDGMSHWHCTLNMSSYLWNVRSLKDAAAIGLGIDISKGVRDRAKDKTPEDMVAEGWWGEMVKYGMEDAQNCWHLWDRHSHKFPEMERRLSRLTIDQGRHGVRIDAEALETAIKLLERVIFAAGQNLPWVIRGRAPASPIGIAEECKLNGIPPPPVKARDPEAAQDWEDEYAPRFKFVHALKNLRKAKKTLATLQTIQLRIRADGTVAFSLKYGRTWRNRLSNAWFDGSDAREPNGALLRQLRNQFGPRWLRRFRFKDGLKEYRGWKLQHHPAAAAQNLFSAEQDGITIKGNSNF